MIIFMAGYPFSGKSYVVGKLLELLPNDYHVVVINPKEYVSGNTEEEIADSKLYAWEACLDVLESSIMNKDDRVVLFDTACATYGIMSKFFKLAKSQGRRVVYCFVSSPISLCVSRSNGSFSSRIVEKYKEKFLVSIPKLSELADDVFVVENINKSVDVSSLVGLVKSEYKGGS
jgi:predicted kinase